MREQANLQGAECFLDVAGVDASRGKRVEAHEDAVQAPGAYAFAGQQPGAERIVTLGQGGEAVKKRAEVEAGASHHNRQTAACGNIGNYGTGRVSIFTCGVTFLRGQHVEQMMFQVLFTAPGERIDRPDFGCGVKRLVFAPNSEVSASLAQVTIFQALTRWLGTAITVNDVKALAIEERLEIKIAYTLKARGERRYLNLEVTR